MMSQFFKDNLQEQSVLRGHDRTVGLDGNTKRSNIKTLYMLPFSEDQIRNYLKNNLGEPTASTTFEFIKTVHNLMGLASKPLLMKYILKVPYI